VEVNPVLASPPGLIADGTINGRPWQFTGLRQQFGGTLCQRFRAGESTCAQARPPLFTAAAAGAFTSASR